MSAIALVVAVADNGVIGKGGAMPWRIADDLQHFKTVTWGKPCIMGRKTWDSLPRKPLPGRTNIIVTRDPAFAAEGAVPASSFAAALADAKRCGSEICVIGGAEIYRVALPFAQRIYLTEIHGEFDGDTKFLFERSGWRETAREDRMTPDGLRYSFVTLTRA